MSTPKSTDKSLQSSKTEKKDSVGISEYLSPDMRQMINGADEVTLEDIEKLKNFEVKDSEEAFLHQKEILHIKDMPNDSQIGHLIFRWLNPRHRARRGMEAWRWVTGDLAKLVRSKGVVTETIGGTGTSAIVNGDLMLAFMPRNLHQSRKKALRSLSQRELDTIMEAEKIESSLDPQKQELSRSVSIRKTYEGREVK